MPVLPPIDDDHPFNQWMRRGVWAIVGLLVLLVVFAQQFTGGFFAQVLDKPLDAQRTSEALGDPSLSGLAIRSKVLVKTWAVMREARAAEDAAAMDADLTAGVEKLAGEAVSRTDRLRVAIVAVELLGVERGLGKVEAIWREATPGGALAEDAQRLRRLYASRAGEAALDMAGRQALVDRHGWFGRLALSHDAPPTDEYRREVLGGMGTLMRVSVLTFILFAVAFIAGVGLFIVTVSRTASGAFTSTIERSETPGHVYGEMFAVGMLVFLVSTLANLFYIDQHPVLATVLGEGLMWAVAAAVAWPKLRGVGRETFAPDLGLVRGEGLAREATFGVGAWMISVPITLLASIVLVVLLPEGDEPATGVPLFEPPRAGGWTGVVLGAVGAVVWAPLVEECLFRGALHRWLPEGFGVAGRVAISSAIFGMVHPYDLAGLIQVGMAGAVYGLLREWRGSLVGPIVAHTLHNATLTAINVGTLVALE